MTEKLLLTAEEAAEALSLGRTKVYELLAKGELRSVRIGGCRRIPDSALREFVDRLLDGADTSPSQLRDAPPNVDDPPRRPDHPAGRSPADQRRNGARDSSPLSPVVNTVDTSRTVGPRSGRPAVSGGRTRR